MDDPEPAKAVWNRLADELTYGDAVSRLHAEDKVLRGYLAQQHMTGVDEEKVTAEFHREHVVGEVLASGYGEYEEYQDAVEQRDRAVEEYGRTRLSARRLFLLLWLVTLRWQVAFVRRQWRNSLPAALADQVGPVLRRLIGEDHNTLLVTPDILGLVEVHDLRYVVPHREQESLEAKMELMAGGTLAISGPRGVGKSTLLRDLAEKRRADNHLVVPVEIPSAYVPQEFLLSLFQRVCEQFLAMHGRAPDSSFVFLIKLRKHILLRIRGAVSFGGRLLVAAVLLSVALAPAARAMNRSLDGGFSGWLTRTWDDIWASAVQLWTDHPWLTRVPLALLGLGILVSLPRWQKKSPLLKECVNYLYLLRTAQSTSLATTTGLTPFSAGTVGAGRTTTLSSRTLTFPELVVHFRDLLERMAKAADNGRIFIVIDEIDRIGTADDARSLLAEIKAVFGIPNVYFLISVAEDVGADFVRRGLPVRDIIDSSLDDVVHIEPRTLEESHAILQNRVPGLTTPFIALAHCLSGGITRDLIRYTRRMVTIPSSGRNQLPQVAHALLWDELRETLSGFRVLLARADHPPDWAQRMDDTRLAVLLLQERPGDEQTALARDAVRRLIDASAPPTENAADTGPSPETRRQWDELGAYGDFMLTLLDFFGRKNFPTLDDMKDAGNEWDVQRLAEARRELALSPAATRLALKRFREAWGMPESDEP
ncbi:P-loop NTPase fold protein [Streptomyces sp. NBC_01381]|uniref:P-loop NTPase fold protein n=1 Tax=Streptomyces sp. NBC_01381 TaxID=2903845 RepID=UPI0022563F7A|nr:P-loop NTPase fold protein [Streptomyces sp. NBC_01381]MCX4671250.1 P-loop NTPase fold protein [Streptomyces sp. NBC_01381]